MASDFHTHTVHPGKNELVNGALSGAALWSLPFHPWETKSFPDIPAEMLVKCAALGELGFDKFRGALPYPEAQMMLFRQLLELAQTAGKPVVLHAVGPVEELFKSSRAFPGIRFLVHGFSKHNPRLLKQLLDNGFYVSLHPALTDDEELKAFLKSCPGCRVGLETDDRNDLAIEELYEKINIPGFEKAADLHFREFLQL
jgi:Tat protein secretion system quality control protein TatD with DNase activity